jgi:hypothetical protein
LSLPLSALGTHPLALEAELSDWYSEDDVIMKEGDKITPNSKFFIVVAGRVRVVIAGKFIGYREVGSYFGETGLIELKPRSASVIADGELRLVAFTKLSFYKVLRTPGTQQIFAERMQNFDSDKGSFFQKCRGGATVIRAKEKMVKLRLAELKAHELDEAMGGHDGGDNKDVKFRYVLCFQVCKSTMLYLCNACRLLQRIYPTKDRACSRRDRT